MHKRPKQRSYLFKLYTEVIITSVWSSQVYTKLSIFK